jgi:hypothetical protein
LRISIVTLLTNTVQVIRSRFVTSCNMSDVMAAD